MRTTLKPKFCGWADSSVGKVLAWQPRGPKFGSQYPHNKLAMVLPVSIPTIQWVGGENRKKLGFVGYLKKPKFQAKGEPLPRRTE